MVVRNRSPFSLGQRWLLFLILSVMVLSGFYLVIYIRTALKIGYVGIPKDFNYWLIFPYSETYLIALLVGVMFVFCGFVFIFKLKKSTQVFLKNPIVMSWSVLSILALLILGGFIILLSAFGNVDHLDSVTYKQHTLHLAFKNNNEYGFSYYLFDCDRHTSQCEMVASFFPNDLIFRDDNAQLSKLYIDEKGLVTITYNEQVIYEYALLYK